MHVIIWVWSANLAFNCFFMFPPITLIQLNSFTSMDTFSCLGGFRNNRFRVRNPPKDLYGDVFVFVVVAMVLHLCPKHIICHEMLRVYKIFYTSSAHGPLRIPSTISRAWCKTIVTSYINWGSYHSFAPSPRYTLMKLKRYNLNILKVLWYGSMPSNDTISIQVLHYM